MQELLANTASLTNSLADRDQLIGEVITNLSALMTTVDDHHQELNELIISLQGVVRRPGQGPEGDRLVAEEHLRASPRRWPTC